MLFPSFWSAIELVITIDIDMINSGGGQGESHKLSTSALYQPGGSGVPTAPPPEYRDTEDGVNLIVDKSSAQARNWVSVTFIWTSFF